MNDKYDTASERDPDLARYFRQMREEDSAQTPEFPQQSELAARSPLIVRAGAYGTVPKVAAAAAVVAVTFTALLMTRPAQQDPGVVYADIMHTSSFATDSLLSVSQGTLPGMFSLPDVYEVESPTNTVEDIN